MGRNIKKENLDEILKPFTLEGRAIVIRNIAHCRPNSYSICDKFIKESIDYYESLGNITSATHIKHQLGEHLYDSKEILSSLEEAGKYNHDYYDTAKAYAAKLGLWDRVVDNLIRYNDYYDHNCFKENAIKLGLKKNLFEKVISIYMQSNDKNDFNKALNLAIESNKINFLVDLLQQEKNEDYLAVVYERVGDYEKAKDLYIKQNRFYEAGKVMEKAGNKEEALLFFIVNADKYYKGTTEEIDKLVKELGHSTAATLYEQSHKYTKSKYSYSNAAYHSTLAGEATNDFEEFRRAIIYSEKAGDTEDAMNLSEEIGDKERAKIYENLLNKEDFFKRLTID